MTQSGLQSALRSLVQRHGFELVSESLQEIGHSDPHLVKAKENAAGSNTDIDLQTRKGAAKTTAPQYVAKMQLPPEKEWPVLALAQSFQAKTFLPSANNIATFCQIYRIDQPASKSRSSAIPRVFKFIASMDAPDIYELMDSGMFSGPSRLGPIADAIRNYGSKREYGGPFYTGNSP